jgi:pyridinium-3,5-biscarboxylic acid mononucleotide synthase
MAKILEIEDYCKFDLDREKRTGVPEIILAEGKDPEHLKSIVKELINRGEPLIVTRLERSVFDSIKGLGLEYFEKPRIAVWRKDKKSADKKIALLSAGTADFAVAEEARIVAEELGCEVIRFCDVGVAGLPRLLPAVEKIKSEGARVVIVVAGMEGALPSVVAGLFDGLVIGVPTSTGYGYGGKGEAALKAMLQSCSPGVVTVNIDNGVGAAVAAALIAKK